MKTFAKKFLSMLTAATLACSLYPASAVASGVTPPVDGKNQHDNLFDQNIDEEYEEDLFRTYDNPDEAKADTLVYLRAIDTSFHVESTSEYWQYGSSELMEVHTVYSVGNEYTVQWYRSAAFTNAQGTTTVEEATLLGTFVETRQGTGDNNFTTFTYDPSKDTFYDEPDRTYEYKYWAVIIDTNGTNAANKKASSENMPIVVSAEGNWYAGSLWWPDNRPIPTAGAPEGWIWGVSGWQDAQEAGASGVIAGEASLDGTPLTQEANPSAWQAFAGGGNVCGAWDMKLALAGAQTGKPAFQGTILAKIDVSEWVQDILNDNATYPTADAKRQAIENALSVYKLNDSTYPPTANPLSAAGLTLGGDALKFTVDDEGHAYATFLIQASDANRAGALGSYAVVRAVSPDQDVYTVTATVAGESGEGGEGAAGGSRPGSVSPTIAKWTVPAEGEPAAEPPTFTFYPNFGYEASVAVSGGAALSDCTLGANFITFGKYDAESGEWKCALTGDASLVVTYTKIPEATGGPFAVELTELPVWDANNPTQITFIGADGTIATVNKTGLVGEFPAGPLVMQFNAEAGHNVVGVEVQWEDGTTDTFLVHDGTLTVDNLKGAANIRVLMEDSTVEPVQPFAVRVACDSGGSVDVPSKQVAPGGAARFVITAANWSKYTGFTAKYADGTVVPASNVRFTGDERGGTLVVYNVMRDVNVQVHFAYADKTVQIPMADDVPGLSSVSPSPVGVVSSDKPLVVTIRPDSNYKVESGDVVLTDAAGNTWTPPVVQNADGTVSVTVPIEQVGDWTEPIQMSITPRKNTEDKKYRTITTQVTGQGGTATPTFRVPDGQSATVVLVPDAGYVPSVFVDGREVVAVENGGNADANVVFYNGVDAASEHFAAPCVVFKEVSEDYVVSVTFAKPDTSAGEDPAPTYKPVFEITSEFDASQGEVSPGKTAQVYDGEEQVLTVIPADRHVIDYVAIDGVYIFFDDAQLKDDPAALAQAFEAAGIGWDGSRYTISAQDGKTETFTFDPASGRLVFDNVSNAHKVSAGFARIKDVQVRVESAGGVVNAGGTVCTSNSFVWKIGEALPIYLLPDEGYDVKTAQLDGQDIKSSLENISRADVPEESDGSKLISQLVESITLADKAYAAPTKAYLYNISPEYMANLNSETVLLRVEFDTESALNAASHTVNVKVRSGYGKFQDASGNLTTEASFNVADGRDLVINVQPDLMTPYTYMQIGSGVRVYYGTKKQIELSNVVADADVFLDFESTPYAGNNSDVSKTARHLQALAKTGDLNAPLALGLLSIAFAACGIALLVTNRRRQSE